MPCLVPASPESRRNSSSAWDACHGQSGCLMPQTARTESEIVAVQYQSWVYPAPVQDMAEAVAGGYWDRSDPSLFRRKLWPRKTEPDDLEILVAGCGTNQAA